MDFIFADDSQQKKPSRHDMGPLIAIGGIHLSGEKVSTLERAIRAHCKLIGFPEDEQFKWSPGKEETFQREQLIDEKRTSFYIHLLSLALEHGATATVVIADRLTKMARKQSTKHEEDTTALFLERCDWSFRRTGKDGVVIIAKPSGGSGDEKKFVADCLDLIQQGTEYMSLQSIGLGVLTAPSKQIRLLQLADVITSCVVARVGGESNFSPLVFSSILPLFRIDGTRRGGVGLKIHPDFKYANLYYWLLGDTHWWKGNSGVPLPRPGMPYATSAGEAAYKLKGSG